MVGEHELSERQNIVSKHPERADALGCKGVDSYYVAVYNTAIDFNLNITNAVPCVSLLRHAAHGRHLSLGDFALSLKAPWNKSPSTSTNLTEKCQRGVDLWNAVSSKFDAVDDI